MAAGRKWADSVLPAARLTPREREVISLALQARKNAEIAAELDPPCAEQTVKNHLKAIYDKVGVDHKMGLLLWVIQHDRDLAASALAGFATCPSAHLPTCPLNEVNRV
jgi:DNA-binding NarL/FixJ family response regulator